MNDRDQRSYDRLLRVQTFGIENTADFSATSKARIHFANVDQHIKDLDTAKAGQKPARASKETLLEELRADLKNISRTARAIALSDATFASTAYRLPENPAERELLTLADSVLAKFEPAPGDSAKVLADKTALAARFIAYELPADFVADLRHDLDAIRQTTQSNQGETLDGVENTGAIAEILPHAARDVQELDATMHNKYAAHPEKLKAWRSASRVERAPVREKKVAPAGGGATAPTV